MNQRRTKRKKSLYTKIAIYTSAAIVLAATIEGLISRGLISKINEGSLKKEASETLTSYSSYYKKKWEENIRRDDQKECCSQEQLDSFLDGSVSNKQITPILSHKNLISLPEGSQEFISQNTEKILSSLNRDEDKFIIIKASTGESIAIASKTIKLDQNNNENQIDLILALKWPLLKHLIEIDRAELNLKLITLLTVILVNLSLVRQLLKPLKKIEDKTKELTHKNLQNGIIEANAAPREVHNLIASYNKLLKTLDEEYECQKAFAANLSHEFKNPLANISGYIDSILYRSKQLEQKEAEKLVIVKSEAERLSKLVNDLLDLSLMNRNQLQYRNTAIKPSELLDSTCKVLQPLCKQEILLQINTDCTDAKTIGDPSRYIQIVSNLIDNASKYSQQGTVIRVTLSMDEKFMYTDIADKGPGISKEDQQKIFERFYRSPTSINYSRKRSSGLGLSVVLALAKSMNASIELQSTPGHGSRFTLKQERIYGSSEGDDVQSK